MALTALVILLLLIQYMVFTALTGRARVKYYIRAPDCAGHPTFERVYRVQMNTLEQLIVVIPAMWICGLFFNPYWVGPLLGLVFFVARILYAVGYIKDPKSRGLGMMIGSLASGALVLMGIYATLLEMFYV